MKKLFKAYKILTIIVLAFGVCFIFISVLGLLFVPSDTTDIELIRLIKNLMKWGLLATLISYPLYRLFEELEIKRNSY